MIVQPIVEGQGDVQAIPVLFRRFVETAGAWPIQISRPHRRRRSELATETGLKRAIGVARLTPGVGAIVVIFDADKDCPKTMAPQLAIWAREAAGGLPCELVLANREYEAWLLAGMDPLRGSGLDENADPHPSPESPRDAKGELEARMPPGRAYFPTVDQASFSARFDMASAHRSSRSFRKLTKAFGVVLEAAGLRPAAWPPGDWAAEHRGEETAGN